jgi:hypothetical protein
MMKDSIFTPGPWHTGHIGDGQYRREVVFDRQSGLVATLTMPGGQGELEASLIAAAPTMLNALKAASSELSLLLRTGNESRGTVDVLSLVDDALAKAEGR